MADKEFSVLALLDLDLKGHNSLNLRCLHGRKGLVREITIPDVNRPGLALSGFFESFAYKRKSAQKHEHLHCIEYRRRNPQQGRHRHRDRVGRQYSAGGLHCMQKMP